MRVMGPCFFKGALSKLRALEGMVVTRPGNFPLTYWFKMALRKYFTLAYPRGGIIFFNLWLYIL